MRGKGRREHGKRKRPIRDKNGGKSTLLSFFQHSHELEGSAVLSRSHSDLEVRKTGEKRRKGGIERRWGERKMERRGRRRKMGGDGEDLGLFLE